MRFVLNCIILSILSFLLLSCGRYDTTDKGITDVVKFSEEHYRKILRRLGKKKEMSYPYSYYEKDATYYDVDIYDKTSGYFPGALWYLYRLTGNIFWKNEAIKYTEALDAVKIKTNDHNISMILECSFLNGIRYGNIQYDSIIVRGAKSFSSCFRNNIGIIESKDTRKYQNNKKHWSCPVEIDNMMGLELLFEATKITGDSLFYEMAISHANRTMDNHFRPNNSCYNIVDYDLNSGKVRSRETIYGFSDESAWARGQAMALYGYTVCYRYTKDVKYYKLANNIYNFIYNNGNLPPDLVPYWDYDSVNIPNEAKDASSASIAASALYELFELTKMAEYKKTADDIMKELCSPEYYAELETNGDFLLKHSTGNFYCNKETDVPLNYADYYFLESLVRKRYNK